MKKFGTARHIHAISKTRASHSTNIIQCPNLRRIRRRALQRKAIKEVRLGLCSQEELQKRVDAGTNVILKGKLWKISVGDDLMAKINVLIGASHKKAYLSEVKKIETLSSLPYGPDIIQDLSLVRFDVPLYQRAMDIFGGPVGTLPTYISVDSKKGTIEPSLLLETIEEQAENGVSFMSLHAAVSLENYELAKKTRTVPITSRGGGIVIRDMLAKGEKEGVVSKNFDKILKILKKHGVVLSLGCSFRSASLKEWLDQVQQNEILLQGRYIQAAKEADVPVMLESGGSHAPLSGLEKFKDKIKIHRVPIMPLGPLTTDSAIGADHLAAAIGASYLAHIGGAHVFASVSPQEHTGGVPCMESMIEGLKALVVALHSVNVSRFPKYRELTDDKIAEEREKTCVVGGGLFGYDDKESAREGCSRCDSCCPLTLKDN